MSQDRKKLLINIASSAVTTAVVVDCPTPLAPPDVVKPQLQPIMAMITPKKAPLTKQLDRSHTLTKFRAESRNTVSERLYIFVATINPPNIPVIKDSKVKTGSIVQQAITRGITR
jgi:hypothetical protein